VRLRKELIFSLFAPPGRQALDFGGFLLAPLILDLANRLHFRTLHVGVAVRRLIPSRLEEVDQA
jgi:hypothetical protein